MRALTLALFTLSLIGIAHPFLLLFGMPLGRVNGSLVAVSLPVFMACAVAVCTKERPHR